MGQSHRSGERARARRRRPRRWIQAALKGRKKGTLHRQLGIAEDEKIPASRLRRAAKAPGKLGKRARLALTLRNLSRST